MFTQMEGFPSRSVRQSQRLRSGNGPKAPGATLWSVLAHAGPVPLPKPWVAMMRWVARVRLLPDPGPEKANGTAAVGVNCY